MIVLSLFDYSGVWARPWVEAGYEVVQVDSAIQDKRHKNHLRASIDLSTTGAVQEVMALLGTDEVFGVLSAPPCDCFTRASAWKWREWDSNGRTEEALRMVDNTLALVELLDPQWWVLENPPGRLWKHRGKGLRQKELGPLTLKFHPWEYGALAPNDPVSRRVKKTFLWGDFKLPARAPTQPCLRGVRLPSPQTADQPLPS